MSSKIVKSVIALFVAVVACSCRFFVAEGDATGGGQLGGTTVGLIASNTVTDASVVGVQLWENGPYWAECNVGATKPEEPGYYFWWGDTVGYKRNASNDCWVAAKDGAKFSFSIANCPTFGKSNDQLKSTGYIDSTGNLVAKHDAATAHLGAPWRMPTEAEFAGLCSNCTTKCVLRDGIMGRLVVGKGAYAAKSIFIPAAGDGFDFCLGSFGSYGYYWSSTSYSGNSNSAWSWYFYSGDSGRFFSNRYYGRPVRPVR